MSDERIQKGRGLRTLWVASAWLFVLAAMAGVFFRWGMVAGYPEGLRPHYLRHGHSHLMLMGWATPALMALMAARWPALGGRESEKAVLVAGWAAWTLALVSFPLFIIYGYESVPLGSAELPLAAMASGFAMLAWYGFAGVYWWAHRGVPRGPALRIWDLAVVSLVVSSLGAWAVAAVMMSGVESALWEEATIHFFVDLFGSGWLMLGVLGLIRAEIGAGEGFNERVGRVLVAAAIGFVFLAGLSRSHTPQVWLLVGSAAAGLLAAGLALLVQSQWSRVGLWSRRVLLLLGLQIGALTVLAIPPLADWGLSAGLRLLYLHLAFVGVVTLGLVVMARERWGRSAVASPAIWCAAVLALLGSMVPLTGLWPRALGGFWVLYLAFGGAVVATILAAGECFASMVMRRLGE